MNSSQFFIWRFTCRRWPELDHECGYEQRGPHDSHRRIPRLESHWQAPIGRSSAARSGPAVQRGPMSVCRICGNDIRDDENVVDVAGNAMHPDCSGAPKNQDRRWLGLWASMGSRAAKTDGGAATVAIPR